MLRAKIISDRYKDKIGEIIETFEAGIYDQEKTYIVKFSEFHKGMFRESEIELKEEN